MMTAGLSLALARVHPFGDAGLYAASGMRVPIVSDTQVPSAVRAMLEEKCADCHSTQTRSPIYGRFAPVSWQMERDITRGREAMNLSSWDSYSADQRQSLAAKIAHETTAHQMPLLQYRMIHWNARVTDAELRTLAGWAQASPGFSESASNQPAGEGDRVRGKELFEKRCIGCHSLTQNRQGPRLQGVYGRVSGSVPDYAYSTKLKMARIVWNETSLEQWLADPDAVLPGNNMDFLVPKPQERRDIISYLRQVSGT
jgi:cytochrome c